MRLVPLLGKASMGSSPLLGYDERSLKKATIRFTLGEIISLVKGAH